MRFSRINILLSGAVFWAGFGFLGTASVMAQMMSPSYQLPAGGAVGGGGKSTSMGHELTGSMPLGAAGKSGSSDYILIGGLTGAIFEGSSVLKASYSGSALMPVMAGADHQLEIALSGTTGVDSSAVFYYRLGGELSYTGVDMTKAAGGVFRYTVTGDRLGIAGMEYYLKVKIGSDSVFVGSSGCPYAFVSIMTNSQGQRPTAMPDAKYRIIGIPIDISGSHRVEAVFADDLGTADKKQWRLGSYDNGVITEYPSAANATIGRGYWLAARGAKKYGAAGVSVRPNCYIDEQGYYRIDLDSGWNQVANPFPFNLNWSEMLFDDNGTLYDKSEAAVLDSVAYAYTGSAYSSASIISAWDGVFIFIKKAGVKALFPFKGPGLMTKSNRPLADMTLAKAGNQSWTVHLAVESNGRIDDGNFAGVQRDALDGADDFDMHEPPLAPEGPSVAFLVPGDNSPRRMDIRSPFSDGAEWNLIFTLTPNRTLKIENLTQMPDDMTCWLILDNGSKVNIEEGMAINLDDNIKTARMIIGTEQYLKENGSITMPSQYVLYQNYPNPFNPTTHIKFALPKAGAVQLDIFNILGQRVISLIDGELPAGHHTVSWDGEDINGNQVASGVYFCRLKTDNFEQTRKMQLLK
jgi:hypothetical protein